MKQNSASKLSEQKEQQLWNYLNEIALTQIELSELDKAFEKFQKDVSALFVRIEAIEDIRGEEQTDTAFDEQIKQIINQIDSNIDKLNQIHALVEQRRELINKYTARLKTFIENLPPKEPLVVKALQRLKNTKTEFRKYAQKFDDQEQAIEDYLQRVRKHQGEKAPSDPVTVSSYQNETIQLFLCHSSRDKPLVRKLYDDLSKAGFKPWLDEIDLLPGQEWELEIRHAIEKANFFLACLSQNAIDEKGYVHKEIKIALDILDKIPEGRIYLIPVRFENCRVPDRLSSRQWVDLFEPNGLGRLIKALHAH
jgi:hypothetical protein